MVILLLLAVLICAKTSYATHYEGEPCKTAKVQLMGSNIDFSNSVFVLDGEIMVPAVELLEKLGVHITWNPLDNELICYDNNIFLKIRQNIFFIKVNGNRVKLKVPTFVYNGDIYASAQSLLQVLEIKYQVVGNTVVIDYQEASAETIEITHTIYRKYSLLETGISLFVPEYYTYLGREFTTIHDNSKITIIPWAQWNEPISENKELPAEQNESETNGNDRTGEGKEESTLPIPRRLGNHNYKLYPYTEDNAKIVEYVLENEVVLRFRDVPQMVADNIAMTLNADKIYPNTSQEHYFEFADFHNSGIVLEHRLYSNMFARNQIPFSGTCPLPEEQAVALYCVVTKGAQSFDIVLPIESKRFEGKIYLPFGLGKHNVKISRVDSTGKHYDLLLFSALNESDELGQDLVPTLLIDYENPSTYRKLAAMGQKGLNQNEDAFVLYKWFVEHMTIDKEIQSLRKMSLLLEETKVSTGEAAILLCGFFRASGIVSHVVLERETQTFWVEAYLNGQWTYMGIVEDIIQGTVKNYAKPVPRNVKNRVQY